MENVLNVITGIDWLFILRMIVQIGFAFGIVVFVHELGHFIVAKLVGVGTPEFAIGMGPEIWGFDRGGTRYKFCAFPIGGYVNLIGETGDEDVSPEDLGKSLQSKKTWQKISVMFAGPFMNFVLAVFLNAMVLMVWGIPRELDIKASDLSPTMVAAFVDPREAPGKAGMQTGDTIISVNGAPVLKETDVVAAFVNSKGKPIDIVVKRDHKTLNFKVTPKASYLSDTEEAAPPERQIGIMLDLQVPGLINGVVPGRPAQQAGLMAGDTILSINGTAVNNSEQIKPLIGGSKGEKIEVLVKRGDKQLRFSVAPKAMSAEEMAIINPATELSIGIQMSSPAPRVVEKVAPGSPAALAGIVAGDVIMDFDKEDFQQGDLYKASEPMTTLLVLHKQAVAPVTMTIGPDKARVGQDIGITLLPLNERLGLVQALSLGTNHTVNIVYLTVVALKKMITREIPASGIAGPIGIVQYASTFARSGIRQFISFFALISVSLAFINLVPFPALDGSHILIALLEGIRGKAFDARRKQIIITAGFYILIGLIVLVTFHDLRKWIGF